MNASGLSCPLRPGSLYYGDCLDIMGQWPDEQADLIYLDPPFHSKANYNQLYGKDGNGVSAQFLAFSDTWFWNEAAAERYGRLRKAVAHRAHKAVVGLHSILGESGMLAYLTYMGERLEECRKLLKPDGSIWLHCDPSASHYLKVLMDAIFGYRNFINEIVWCYKSGGASPKRYFSRKHDIILWYSKSGKYTYIPQSEKSWNRGLKRYNFAGVEEHEDEIGWHTVVGMKDYWNIDMVGRTSRERTGYPTQKPLALLERIIGASSDKDDLVIDPFCGCGTTLVAAERLGRKWAGIDISPFAARLVRDKRLKDPSIPIYGIPKDMEGARLLLKKNALDFETWMVTSIDGMAANRIQTGDRGIDGRGKMFTAPEGERGMVLAQVKGGGHTASAMRDFKHVMDREKASAGIFITLERVTSRSALAEATAMGAFKMGASSWPRLQFWSTEEYLRGVAPRLPAMADPYTGKAVQTDLLQGT